VKAIVGLGNPGPKYDKTRHNAGFWVIDAIAGRLGVAVDQPAAKSLLALTAWEGVELLLVKPLTYMNASGEAVSAIARRYQLVPEEILVVYDDLDLVPGVIRMRAKGRAGSHNGMRSIINYLGTQDFPRLRIGIGPVPDGVRGVDYVLGTPAKDEWARLQAAVEAAAQAALTWVVDGVEAAMSRFNRAWAPREA
jgi:peptidyl-tRNA hydrolase, PTH1 family